MSLFRRFRREKEAEPAEKPKEEAEPVEEPKEQAKPSPVEEKAPVVVPPVLAEPSPPVRTEASSASLAPPPLPDRPIPPPSPPISSGTDALSKCFICGTPLSGKTCPTCHMTWVE